MNEPAFPQRSVDSDGNLYERGMTLRDYFAAKAVVGLIGRNWDVKGKGDMAIIEQWGRSAYAVADAMLKARSATNTDTTKE